jgi:large conductance mechanosensitive channel
MPPIGVLTGKVSFKDLAYPLVVANGKPTASINYGAFITNVITFLIVAWAVFMLVKAMNAAEKRLRFGDEPAEDKPAPPEDVLLLREIRDELKRRPG